MFLFFIEVLRASKLMNEDIVGLSDPYVVVKGPRGSDRYKTRTIDDNLNPVWEESVMWEYNSANVDDLNAAVIYFECYDKDSVSDDLLGKDYVKISDLRQGERNQVELKMEEDGILFVAITPTGCGKVRKNVANDTGNTGDIVEDVVVQENVEDPVLLSDKEGDKLAYQLEIIGFYKNVIQEKLEEREELREDALKLCIELVKDMLDHEGKLHRNDERWTSKCNGKAIGILQEHIFNDEKLTLSIFQDRILEYIGYSNFLDESEEAEPVQEPEPEPVKEPEYEPEPEPEPVKEPEPELVQILEPEPEPVKEPEPEQEPEPVKEPEPELVQILEPEPEPVQILEPEPVKVPEPVHTTHVEQIKKQPVVELLEDDMDVVVQIDKSIANQEVLVNSRDDHLKGQHRSVEPEPEPLVKSSHEPVKGPEPESESVDDFLEDLLDVIVNVKPEEKPAPVKQDPVVVKNEETLQTGHSKIEIESPPVKDTPPATTTKKVPEKQIPKIEKKIEPTKTNVPEKPKTEEKQIEEKPKRVLGKIFFASSIFFVLGAAGSYFGK
jgi:hypothetical protein